MIITIEKFAKVAVDLEWTVYHLGSDGRICSDWHYGQLHEVGKVFFPETGRNGQIWEVEKFLGANNTAVNKAVKKLLTSSP